MEIFCFRAILFRLFFVFPTFYLSNSIFKHNVKILNPAKKIAVNVSSSNIKLLRLLALLCKLLMSAEPDMKIPFEIQIILLT